MFLEVGHIEETLALTHPRAGWLLTFSPVDISLRSESHEGTMVDIRMIKCHHI